MFEKNVVFWHRARVSTMSRNKIRNIIENTVDDDHGDKTTGQPAWARSRSWKLREKSANNVRSIATVRNGHFHKVCLHFDFKASDWLKFITEHDLQSG